MSFPDITISCICVTPVVASQCMGDRVRAGRICYASPGTVSRWLHSVQALLPAGLLAQAALKMFLPCSDSLRSRITSHPDIPTIGHTPFELTVDSAPKADMDTIVINAEERLFHKHRLAAVAEHERLLANRYLLPVRTIPVNKNDDTEPCFTSNSRIHRLICGHTVYTHQPTLCGKTCQIPLTNFAPFLCTLCERWDMVPKGQVSRRSSNISALTLPDFPDVDQSQIPFMLQARQCYVVYRLHNGALFVPFSVENMAMVRLCRSTSA
jgi:hypothetical protein